MIRLIIMLFFFAFHFFASAQSYVKMVPTRDTSNTCKNAIDLIPYGGTVGPYMITWWDNEWQPSTGFRAEDLCEGATISTDIVDMNCRILKSQMHIFPDSIPQLYLDTVIAVLPSIPGGCDGSISFHFRNVSSGFVRRIASSSGGGITMDSVFTNLCEDDYTYFITGFGAKTLGGVSVSLRYGPVLPCAPFKDSLVLTAVTLPGMCDGGISYNTTSLVAAPPGLYGHFITKPIGGGSVIVNQDSLASFNGLCSGPHIVRTEIFNNNYFVSNSIFVDNPLINDSTWGSSISSQIDTVVLSAITNCGINYSFNIDTVYISDMTQIANNQYQFEIKVIQGLDTINNYETALVDTSHQLCFDITFFCADTSNFDAINDELHNYIFYRPNTSPALISEKNLKFSQLKLYPNPAINSLTLSNLPIGENRVMLMTIDGKVLQNLNITTIYHKIMLESFSSGFYFLRIQNGTDVMVRKFIINK